MSVMAGLVLAIYVLLFAISKYVDARDKPGHDEFGSVAPYVRFSIRPSSRQTWP